MSDKPKYTPDELRAGYEQIQLIGQIAAQLDLDLAQAVMDSMSFTDAVMPLLDPTGYMQIRQTLPAHRKLAAAFARFRGAIEELKSED